MYKTFYNVAYVFFIFLVFNLTLTACGQKKIPEGCLYSDKLRIQLGRSIFATPRKDIGVLTGQGAQWEGEPRYSNRVEAERICQKKDSPSLILDAIWLDIKPIECKRKEHSSCGKLKGNLASAKSGFLSLEKRKFLSLPAAERRRLSIKKCKERPYFNTCEHITVYKSTIYDFQYNFLSYPVGEIKKIEQFVVSYLQEHDITQKEIKENK